LADATKALVNGGVAVVVEIVTTQFDAAFVLGWIGAIPFPVLTDLRYPHANTGARAGRQIRGRADAVFVGHAVAVVVQAVTPGFGLFPGGRELTDPGAGRTHGQALEANTLFGTGTVGFPQLGIFVDQTIAVFVEAIAEFDLARMLGVFTGPPHPLDTDFSARMAFSDGCCGTTGSRLFFLALSNGSRRGRVIRSRLDGVRFVKTGAPWVLAAVYGWPPIPEETFTCCDGPVGQVTGNKALGAPIVLEVLGIPMKNGGDTITARAPLRIR
jgi:hypothetical protein